MPLQLSAGNGPMAKFELLVWDADFSKNININRGCCICDLNKSATFRLDQFSVNHQQLYAANKLNDAVASRLQCTL